MPQHRTTANRPAWLPIGPGLRNPGSLHTRSPRPQGGGLNSRSSDYNRETRTKLWSQPLQAFPTPNLKFNDKTNKMYVIIEWFDFQSAASLFRAAENKWKPKKQKNRARRAKLSRFSFSCLAILQWYLPWNKRKDQPPPLESGRSSGITSHIQWHHWMTPYGKWTST
jgi:hypothetical protein